jgi:hypothetical protein
MKLIHLLLLTVISVAAASYTFQNEPQTLTVEQASNKGLIKVTIKGKGGYTGEVIEMKIKNLLAKTFKLKLSAGHRLDSKDSTTQDILVNRAEEFILASKEERTYTVSGMCCQAHNHSPNSKSIFKLGHMADSALVKMAEFINTNKLYNSYTAQQAVWVVSDHNRMESISGSDKEELKKVQEFVSKLTGQPIPAYTIDYEPGSTTAFSGKPKELKGVIECYLNANALVTCGAYDKRGQIAELFFLNQPSDPGTLRYEYNFHVALIPKGEYYIRIYADNQLKKEIKVEL